MPDKISHLDPDMLERDDEKHRDFPCQAAEKSHVIIRLKVCSSSFLIFTLRKYPICGGSAFERAMKEDICARFFAKAANVSSPSTAKKASSRQAR